MIQTQERLYYRRPQPCGTLRRGWDLARDHRCMRPCSTAAVLWPTCPRGLKPSRLCNLDTSYWWSRILKLSFFGIPPCRCREDIAHQAAIPPAVPRTPFVAREFSPFEPSNRYWSRKDLAAVVGRRVSA